MHKIAIYGGAFNPPHSGHANVMIEASKQAESLLVVPSFKHPFGKVMVDYQLRIQWLNRIVDRVRTHCSSSIEVSDVEANLAREVGEPIFSFNLLSYVARINEVDPKSVALVVGQDVADLLPTFHLGPKLLDTFSIITIPEQVGVRSTMMRQRLESGEQMPPHWVAPGLDPMDYKIYAAKAA